MLFNSYFFIFVFLPATLLAYYLIGYKWGKQAAFGFLIFASLFFYGWWNPLYVTLITISIVFNYMLGRYQKNRVINLGKGSRIVLGIGIIINLVVLGYFKYANFFISTAAGLGGFAVHIEPIFLPLAISFFTFTQIAYLVDASEGMIDEYGFREYCFFVLFFPHLIAGPIVRHNEILPQIKQSDGRLRSSDLQTGLTFFALGLFKKVAFADSIGEHATALFASFDSGVGPNLIAAWGGVLSYTCQLYFDFSGYSDMAIGLGCLFGIRMPLNFNSPYKARSIIEFWRRWHISLSRFLRDYLYVRLGGNRKGQVRRYSNLFATMILGGLWHGAGWPFLLWGGLHGLYLLINHAWAKITKAQAWSNSAPFQFAYHVLTFFAVIVGWVFFRANSVDKAFSIVKGMMGFNDVILPAAIEPYLGRFFGPLHITFGKSGLGASAALWLIVLLPIVFLMPNSQQIMYRANPALEPADCASPVLWRPSTGWAILIGVVFSVALLGIGRVSEFLYFQF